eukprot:11926330-Karenia_brevis.AAC.1
MVMMMMMMRMMVMMMMMAMMTMMMTVVTALPPLSNALLPPPYPECSPKCFYDNALVAGSQGGYPIPNFWKSLIFIFH